MSRPELQRLLPRAASLLLSLEQRDAADLEALGDVTALDTSMAAHIYKRAEVVPQFTPPVRRTATSLLAGHPMADAWPHIKKFLPAATAALRKCVEAKQSFRRRIAKAGSPAARKNAK